jgi:hypothetical protein
MVIVITIASSVVACGEDEPDPPERARETIDKLPRLSAGWHKYTSHEAGFAIGRPPGWAVERQDSATLLRSPDQLVAVSISADRTSEALEFPLDEYAAQAAEALPGLRDLTVGRARRFDAHYPARAVEATGKTKQGVRQRLLFVVMRREGFAAYAVLIARNAEKDSGYYAQEARRMVRTVRGRPVG